MPGNYSKVATVVTGQTITAAERNTEHDNHITYQTPAGTDDYSATVTEMRTVSDPYPAATPSQPTSLAGELERIRYVLAQITGQTYWYIDPEAAQTAYVLGNGTGRAGGQTITGGTAASETLTLKSTSNATKGKVIFGAAGTTAYDEVNERFGIGTASPAAVLTTKVTGLTGLTVDAYTDLGENLELIDASGEGLDSKTGFFVRYSAGGIAGGVLIGRHGTNWGTYVAFHTHPDDAVNQDDLFERWRINGSGHLLAGLDNAYDIGAAGATRPRDLYLANSAYIEAALYGGTTASQNLDLRSTSNATKGKVIFGAAGTTAYDEVNERFGVGTASPANTLTVFGSTTSALVALRNDTAGKCAIIIQSTGGATKGVLGLAGYFEGNSDTSVAVIAETGEAINFYTGGSATKRWNFSSTGHLLAGTDNSYDIGASGATRPRNVYIAGNAVIGGSGLTVSNMLAVASQNLAMNTTAWTTTATAYNSFSSITVAVGDIIDVFWSAECNAGVSTTYGTLYISQSAGTATLKCISTAGSTLTSGNFKVTGQSIVSGEGWIDTGVYRLICTVAGTATIVLKGATVGGTAADSYIMSHMQVLKNS